MSSTVVFLCCQPKATSRNQLETVLLSLATDTNVTDVTDVRCTTYNEHETMNSEAPYIRKMFLCNWQK